MDFKNRQIKVSEGSIRGTLETTPEAINQGLERTTRAFASLHDAKIKLTLKADYPPLINTQTETEAAPQAVINSLGQNTRK